MQTFYQQYYKRYIQELQNAADKADRWVLNIHWEVTRLQVWLMFSLFFLSKVPDYCDLSVLNFSKHTELLLYYLRS